MSLACTNVRRPARQVESIEVTLTGVTDDHADAALATFAMDEARERPEALFGWEVTRWDGGEARVRLHRD